MIGKRKWLGDFHIPLYEIKTKIIKNIDDWKKSGEAVNPWLHH